MMGKSRKNIMEQRNHYFTHIIGVAHTHILAHIKVECDFENGTASYDICTQPAGLYLCIIVVEAAL